LDRLTCRLCKRRRDLKYFGPRYHSGKYRGGNPVCVDCDAKNQVGSVYKTPKNYLSSRMRDMKQRVKRYDITLDESVDLDFLVKLFEEQNGLCALSGLPMTWMHEGLSSNHGSRRGTNISVDRINPEEGYCPENIRLVCDRVNKMKSNISDGDLYFWCALLVREFQNN